MKIYLRKSILWLYVFLVTIITGAVFMIGCDGSGGGGGHTEDRINCTINHAEQADCAYYFRINDCQGPGNGYSAYAHSCLGYNCTSCRATE